MSTKWKTALIVIALLAVVGVLNRYVLKMDPSQLAARGVGKDPHSHDHDHEHDEQAEDIEQKHRQLVEPLGPEGAPVTIKVLWRNAGDLEVPLRPMMEDIESQYQGHVRIEFPEPDSDEYQRLVEDVTKGVQSGLIINGEMIKQVPEAPLGMVAFSGSPSFEEWGVDDVQLAIEHELEEAGVEFEPKMEHDHGDHAGHDHAGHDHSGHGH
jgi:hypothetical protein